MANPQSLIDNLNTITDRYAKVGRRLNELKKLYAEYYRTFRNDVKSDAALDRKWDLTPDGEEMAECLLKMKVYDKKMSAIKTNLRHLDNEARNMY